MLEPDTQRTDRIFVRVPERVDSSAAVDHSGCFVVLTRFLISADCLSDQFSITWKFNDNSSRIAHIHAEELLTQRHHGDACRSRESDVHLAIEEFFVAVKEGIIEGNAYFIGVESLVIFVLQKLFVIF